MATVTDQLKETLVGTVKEPQLSQETRAAFDRNARRDEEVGELYMTEEEFVNAVAPANEDYVSRSSAARLMQYTLSLATVPLLILINL